jgi:hypothetical protein
MNAIDTNVWIYCHDVRDPEKQQVAQRLIETVDSVVLLWQVGCEFIAAARKLKPKLLPVAYDFLQGTSGTGSDRLRVVAQCFLQVGYGVVGRRPHLPQSPRSAGPNAWVCVVQCRSQVKNDRLRW